MRKTAFIGHRQILGKGVFERVLREAENQIGLGCKLFTMGTHGDFDALALSACRTLRKRFPEIKIEVVITSLGAVSKKNGMEFAPYSDVNIVMPDIENVYFKQRITMGNRRMLDGSDTLICYVDENAYRSGAKAAMRYAKQKGMTVINLYREEDRPFYGMSAEEIAAWWRKP